MKPHAFASGYISSSPAIQASSHFINHPSLLQRDLLQIRCTISIPSILQRTHATVDSISSSRSWPPFPLSTGQGRQKFYLHGFFGYNPIGLFLSFLVQPVLAAVVLSFFLPELVFINELTFVGASPATPTKTISARIALSSA